MTAKWLLRGRLYQKHKLNSLMLHSEAAGAAHGDGLEARLRRTEFLIEYHQKRVYSDRPHRAIAGLSMGGSQTLNIALPHQTRQSFSARADTGIADIVSETRPTVRKARPFEVHF